MNVKQTFMLCWLVFTLSAVTMGQDRTAIYGRVIGSDQKNEVLSGWVVRVTALRDGTNQILDQRDSAGELYCVRVPTNSVVRLIFETSFHPPGQLGYEPARMGSPIDTTPDDRQSTVRAQPDAILTRRTRHEGATALILTQRELNGDIILARETGSTDIVTATFETYREVYRGHQSIITHIDKTEAGMSPDPVNKPFKTTEYRRLIDQLNTPMSASEVPIDPVPVLKMAEEKTTFSDVRSQLLLGLATYYSAPTQPGDGIKRQPPPEVLDFYRKRLASSSSDLLIPSMIALAKIGSEADRQRIVESVVSQDESLARAAIIAIGEGGLGPGAQALAAVVQKGSQPELKRLALQSLVQLYKVKSDDVMIALRKAVLLDPQPYVRMKAAEALGDLVDSSPTAQKVLKDVEKNDKSPDVRAAATTSLERAKP